MANLNQPQFVQPEDVTATMGIGGIEAQQKLQAERQEFQQGLPSFGETMYRSAADVIGTPVDLAAMALAPFGYNEKAPIGGSEYFKQQGEEKGIISTASNPVLEIAGSLMIPDPLDVLTVTKMATPMLLGMVGESVAGMMKKPSNVDFVLEQAAGMQGGNVNKFLNENINMRDLSPEDKAKVIEFQETILPTDKKIENTITKAKVITRDENFKNWFTGSKVVDEESNPQIVYHGTTHSFDEFSPERGNPQNHHGVGFYFSDDPSDVARNYATEEGADLTIRVDRRAEELVDDIMDEQNIDDWDDAYELAKQQAKEELSGEAPNTMPVYLNLKNPVRLSDENPTSFEYRDFDDEGEFLDEPEGEGVELLEALRENIAQYDDWDNANKIVSEVQEEIGVDYFTAEDFERVLRENEEFSYLQDDMGELISHQIISDTYKDIGFDGVILEKADEIFANMGMNPGTTHYVVFEPTNIKSIHNKGSFSEDDANILKSSIGAGIGAGAVGAAMYEGEDNDLNL